MTVLSGKLSVPANVSTKVMLKLSSSGMSALKSAKSLSTRSSSPRRPINRRRAARRSSSPSPSKGGPELRRNGRGAVLRRAPLRRRARGTSLCGFERVEHELAPASGRLCGAPGADRFARSAELAGDVVAVRLSAGRENSLSVSSYSISVPIRVSSRLKKAVLSATRMACCMLWVTITIVYSRLERVDQVLDRGCRDRVERRGGLVEQHHIGLDRDRAGDAEALLLPAGEAERARLQAILDLVPERRAAQRALDSSVEVGLHPEVLRGPRDVVVDRLRERVRLLEDHADPAADLDAVRLRVVQVMTVIRAARRRA